MAVELYPFRPRHRTPRSGRRVDNPEAVAGYLKMAEAAVAEPFRGVTTDGSVVPGLFRVDQTGVPTTPILTAAKDLLSEIPSDGLSFLIDSDEWRRWSNIHPCTLRHGLSLEQLTDAQRERVFAVMSATLSER